MVIVYVLIVDNTKSKEPKKDRNRKLQGKIDKKKQKDGLMRSHKIKLSVFEKKQNMCKTTLLFRVWSSIRPASLSNCWSALLLGAEIMFWLFILFLLLNQYFMLFHSITADHCNQLISWCFCLTISLCTFFYFL